MSNTPKPLGRDIDLTTIGATPLIRITDLTKDFRGVRALDGVSLEVGQSESVGVIGPNGAGKSTLVDLLSGTLRPTSGKIEIMGRDITGLRPHKVAKLGLARTHQVPRPFTSMTVIENLMVASGRTDSRPTRRNQLDRNRKILEETGLAEVEETKAGDLTLIRLKRLELARALALEPQVLLLDEIGAGLIESELEELIALIAKLRERIDCIVIIEHVMDVVVRSCDRLVVLNWGKKLTEGLPTEVLRNDDVMRIYLGASAVEASNSDVTGAIDNTGSKTTAGQSDSIVATPQPDGTVSEKTTTPDSATTVLHVQDLVAGYGASLVVRKVTFSLYEGEVVALLGANGAGKSTISKACTGMLPIRSGQVTLGTQRIDGLSSNNVARNGLAHCMEGRRIFSDLSVEENLTIGATAVGRTGKQVRESLERVYELFPALRGKATQSGGSLSGGQQGMLAIGRSLMADPKVVIFDEISLGLAPVVINEIYDALSILRSQGLTMLLVEQDIDRAMAISDRVLLLEKGRIVLAGSPSELAENPQLRSLYLGVA